MGIFASIFSFKGRIPRGDYWRRLILQPIAVFGLTAAVVSVFEAFGVGDPHESVLSNIVVSAIWLGYLMAFLACHSRRWHDLGMSGWWTLVNLIPLVGLVGLFMCGCMRGDAGPNFYGPDPLQPVQAPEVQSM